NMRDGGPFFTFLHQQGVLSGVPVDAMPEDLGDRTALHGGQGGEGGFSRMGSGSCGRHRKRDASTSIVAFHASVTKGGAFSSGSTLRNVHIFASPFPSHRILQDCWHGAVF